MKPFTPSFQRGNRIAVKSSFWRLHYRQRSKAICNGRILIRKCVANVGNSCFAPVLAVPPRAVGPRQHPHAKCRRKAMQPARHPGSGGPLFQGSCSAGHGRPSIKFPPACRALKSTLFGWTSMRRKATGECIGSPHVVPQWLSRGVRPDLTCLSIPAPWPPLERPRPGVPMASQGCRLQAKNGVRASPEAACQGARALR